MKAASKGKAAIGFVYEDSTEKTEEIAPGKLQAHLDWDSPNLELCYLSKYVRIHSSKIKL